jgi:hypothetical protein
MDRYVIKGFTALKKAFNQGDTIRHIYRNSVVTGIIDKDGYIVSDGLSFTSISTFATYHKCHVIGRPIVTNGWLECEWKKANTSWQPVYIKRNSRC